MTASLPYPPHSGGAIRALGIIHGLHQAGHELTLLCFHDEDNGMAVRKTPLTEYCKQIIKVPPPTRSTPERLRDLILTNRADIEMRLESAMMDQTLRELLKKSDFDLIQFEGIEIAGYLFTATEMRPDILTIYDAFNAEADLQATIARIDRDDMRRLPNAIYSSIQASRISHYEHQICSTATGVLAVSEEDGEILSEMRRERDVFVVPSGVFTSAYKNTEAPFELKQPSLVFTGKMDYRPNVDAMIWFGTDVLPQIIGETDAHLYVVGQKPHQRLDVLRNNPNITITGWVESVLPYLHSGILYVAPLRMGSGTRLKLLEAMSAGCAVVATTTAAAGLDKRALEHMVIADEVQDMSRAIVGLLNDPNKRNQLGRGAQTFVQEVYDWQALIPQLFDAYTQMGLTP